MCFSEDLVDFCPNCEKKRPLLWVVSFFGKEPLFCSQHCATSFWNTFVSLGDTFHRTKIYRQESWRGIYQVLVDSVDRLYVASYEIGPGSSKKRLYYTDRPAQAILFRHDKHLNHFLLEIGKENIGVWDKLRLATLHINSLVVSKE
jgi:hypothetical protein